MHVRRFLMKPMFIIIALSIAYFSFYKNEETSLENFNLDTWNELPDFEFRQQQMRFETVRNAYKAQKTYVKKLLAKAGFFSFEYDLFFRAFKKERVFEVWAKLPNELEYKLITTYPFCRFSGQLGPKRKQGDLQIPEGFYRISHFNPASNYLLSLKVNYPNASDKILSHPTTPGGDIYIHGGCQTVGCIPITDDSIQELYVLAIEAKRGGGKIPIHIFPSKDMESLISGNDSDDLTHRKFWKILSTGFNLFEKNKQLPNVSVLENGDYNFID